MERAVYVGRRNPPAELANALNSSGFDVTAAVDLADALTVLERHCVDCVLLTSDDPASQATRLRRHGHAQPALALVGADDRLPDGAVLDAVVPADDPERVAARARDVVDDRRLRRTRQRRAKRTAALADAREQLSAVPSDEAPSALIDRLVEDGVYTGGWIGRHESSTDVVVPITARGISLEHLRTVTTTDGDEPVVRALQDGAATAESDDTAVLAARIGDGPFVLVCYGDRPNGVTAAEREELHAFADRSPTTVDERDEGAEGPADVDEAVRVLGDAFEHELSNHLDVAGLHLDLAEDDDHLDEVAAALDRINELADEARRLARADVSTELVEVSDVARRAWNRVESDAATLDVEPDGRVDADPELLALLFENLFRNSVQHAGPEVSVTVAVADEGFRVDDDGPGIPDSERDAVLQWGHSTDGTGVGLGIVSLVAERHGWDVSVGESDEGGARFEFT